MTCKNNTNMITNGQRTVQNVYTCCYETLAITYCVTNVTNMVSIFIDYLDSSYFQTKYYLFKPNLSIIHF